MILLANSCETHVGVRRTQISSDDEELPSATKTVMKIDMARDLMTIFSEKVTVKFGDTGKEDGRWCSICR